MWLGGLAATLAAVAAGAVETIAHAAPAASSPEVTTRLTVATTGSPTVVSDLTVRVPRTWPEISLLEDTSPTHQRDEYERILAALLARVGLFERTDAEIIVDYSRELTKPAIEGDTAELTVSAQQPLGYFESFLGPWQLSSVDGDFLFVIDAERQATPVSWHVLVNVGEGLTLDDWAPGVFASGARSVEWRFQPDDILRRLDVRALATEEVEERLYARGWRAYVLNVSGLLASLLVPALVFVLLRRRRLARDGSDQRFVAAANWARRIAIAQLAVTGAALALLVVRTEAARSLVAGAVVSADRWYYGATILNGIEVAVVASAIAFVPPRLVRRPTARTHVWSGLLALLIITASLPVVFSYWPAEDVPAGILESSWALNAVAIALVLGLGAYVVLLAIRATAHLLRDLGLGPIVRRSEIGGRLARHQAVVAVTASLAVATYWLLAHVFAFYGLENRSEGFRLADSLRGFPSELLYAVPWLLSFLLLLALVAMLATAGSNAIGPTLQPQRRAVAWTLALIFAGWSVGLTGAVWYVVLPVPAIAAWFVVLYFTRHRLEIRQAEVETLNPPGASTSAASFGNSTFRHEMLARARELAAARRRQQALYASYRGGELAEDAYDAAYRLEKLREDLLRRGGTSAASPRRRLVTLPPRSSPYSFALSLGPHPTWWQNGQLAAVFAAGLALVPLARYAYHFDWPQTGFAPFYTVLGFGFEFARWVAAAFVFGCLYAYLPGRVGPVKAVLFPLPVAIVVAAFDRVPEAEVPDTLLSNVFLLSLFLVVVGVLMDWWTLRRLNVDARHLGDLYELHFLKRVAVLLPAAIAILAIANAIAGGDWENVKDLVDRIIELITSIG
jgi:hypothetical protein